VVVLHRRAAIMVAVKIQTPEGANVILGQSHFIKTVEDLYEILVSSVPGAKFGVAFCESSGPCLIRSVGNDEDLRNTAIRNAQAVAAGHFFVMILRQAYPINVLNAVKQCPEVCSIFCASANPIEVIVAVTEQGRGVIGVVDGLPPKGVERRATWPPGGSSCARSVTSSDPCRRGRTATRVSARLPARDGSRGREIPIGDPGGLTVELKSPANLRYDADGLIPAIAQDAENGQVLMHAYMNAEAVTRTLETGLAHYYSRSRRRLWRKGEESGHVQRVRAVLYDCDEDTLLLRVDQTVAPATGKPVLLLPRIPLAGATPTAAPIADSTRLPRTRPGHPGRRIRCHPGSEGVSTRGLLRCLPVRQGTGPDSGEDPGGISRGSDGVQGWGPGAACL
jgi:adenosine/AMP kinase/phosphoribosyl-AMP cyclohydrolase